METLKSTDRKWMYIKSVAIFLLIAATFPISISSVNLGLEDSWVYLINIAGERGLKFGTDLLFTYGPLGFLARTLNVGHNSLVAMGFYAILCLIEIGLLWHAFQRLHGRSGIVQLAVFLFFLLSSFSWLGKEYYIGFLFLLSISLAWTEKTSHPYMIISSALTIIAALVKFNAGIQCGVTLVLFIIGKMFTERQSLRRYVWYLPATAAGYVVAFLIYNPSWHALISYISTSLDITSGYSEAMSIVPESRVLLFAILCGISYCAVAFIFCLVDHLSGIYMFLFSGTLFQTFKHGFVRADTHVYGFFAGFLMICGVQILFLDYRRLRATFLQWRTGRWCCGLLTMLMVLVPLYELNPSVQGLVNLYPTKQREILHDVEAQLASPISDAGDDILPDDILKIIDQDSVAILPFELLIDAYNNINMAVMPALQSYEAYTASLDVDSAAFFAKESAPEYIIFTFGTIDNRIDLLETPAIWQSIYENYYAILLSEPYLLLKRADTPYQMELSEADIREMSSAEQIALPDGQYFIKIDADLTLLGKLYKFFYQIPPTMITLTYSDGTEKIGRVLIDVLENGLVLADLPSSLTDMCLTINGIDTGKQIVSFQFGGEGWKYYQDHLTVSFQKVQSDKARCSYTPFQELEVHASDDPTVGLQRLSNPQSYCIDFVNGMPLNDTLSVSNSGLRLTGWALDDAQKCSPYAIYIKVGETYYRMHQTDRTDVFEYLGGYSGEPLCGFDGWIPPDELLPGNYPICLAIICSGGTSYYESPEIMVSILN